MKIRGVVISDPFPVSSGSIDIVPLPERVVVTLGTRWGEAAPLVRVGEEVRGGQCIARSDDARVPPAHAPISGTVEEIKSWPGPLGNKSPAVIIGSDQRDERAPSAEGDAGDDPQKILEALMNAGIREADPYPWPLGLRIAQPDLIGKVLSSPEDPLMQPIETLILNAMDRQPGVSVRDVTFRKRQKEILEVIPYLQKVSGARRVVLAVSKDQSLSEDFQRGLSKAQVEVVACPSRYPAALEPLLVPYVTNREVPLPECDSRRVGAVVVDVVTAVYALHAVRDGLPPLETLVEVTVPRQALTQILRVRTGMVVGDLVQQLEPGPKEPLKVIMGGPFLGYAQHHLEAPVTPEVDSLIFQGKREIFHYKNEPCINCGNCVQLCPVGLMPNELSKYCEYNVFDEAERNHLFNCIECGICAYVCPAKRPMVQMLRFGKQELLATRMES